MSTFRYRSAGPTATQITDFVPGASIVGNVGGFVEYDVALVNDANKDDLDVYMAERGFAFVPTGPVGPTQTQASLLRLPTQADQASLAGDALITFDGTSIRKSLSTGAVQDLIPPGSINIPTESWTLPPGNFDSPLLDGWQSGADAEEDAWTFNDNNDEYAMITFPVPGDWGGGGFTVEIMWGTNLVIPAGIQNVRWRMGFKVLAPLTGDHSVAYTDGAFVDTDMNAIGLITNGHTVTNLGTTPAPTNADNTLSLRVQRPGNTPPPDQFTNNVSMIASRISYKRIS